MLLFDPNFPLAFQYNPLPNTLNSNTKLLCSLHAEHQDLNKVIAELGDKHYSDQLLINRLKKRKLLLKDQIAKIESKLIPDLNA